MSTNHTTNYNLNQWEAADKVLRTDFNEDNAKIDAALKANADAIAAETAARTAAVNSKADQSALNSLSQAVAGLGNCQVWTTSYTGTGTYGEDRPKSITCPKPPLLVVVAGERGHLLFLQRGQDIVTGLKPVQADPGVWIYASWSGSSVSWYTAIDAVEQMNSSGQHYFVVAFLDAAE